MNATPWRARDKQRERCYRWERRQPWFDCSSGQGAGPKMTPDETRVFIETVCRKLGRPMPLIKSGRGMARGGYWAVKLPPWANQKGVILHELAHHFSARDGWYDHHGPWFMRYFIDLVARFLHYSKTALLKSAKAAGLKVAPATQATISKRVRSRSNGHRPTRRSSLVAA